MKSTDLRRGQDDQIASDAAAREASKSDPAAARPLFGFARPTADGPADTASPAAVAAGVRKPNRLKLAETKLQDLRAERAGLEDKIRGLVSEGADLHAQEIKRLVSRRSELEERIRSVRRELMPLRADYASKIATALAPGQVASAKRILAGLAEVRSALAELREIEAELERAGDRSFARMPHADIGALEREACKLSQVMADR